MISGFSITINHKTYWVRCMPIYKISGSNEKNISLKATFEIQIYHNGELIKPNKHSYIAEKISDFIQLKINDKQIKNFKELEENKDE